MGKILEAVKKRYGENALVIFTADHGEMLGNHGVWGKHDCAYDDVWRIPLLVRFPGQSEPSPHPASLCKKRHREQNRLA